MQKITLTCAQVKAKTKRILAQRNHATRQGDPLLLVTGIILSKLRRKVVMRCLCFILPNPPNAQRSASSSHWYHLFFKGVAKFSQNLGEKKPHRSGVEMLLGIT